MADVAEEQEPSRLARRLTTADAVVVGLGSMIGAGVFSAIAPAARAAGGALLIGLVIAAVVAYCNAMSSAWLAAEYPESGGTYVYGRRRLGPFWGHLAGWGFVVGKTASCAAMALTFGAYAAPEWRRPLAIGAVLALMTVNYFGVQKTVRVTQALVAVVLVTLGYVVVAAVTTDGASLSNVDLSVEEGGVGGLLESAGLLFFAFAGYARVATLGEEVIDPRRTIPRAIPIALAIAVAVYAIVFGAALAAVGADELARSDAPLTAVSEAGAVVRAGGAIASLSVLLSLIVGVSRTTFAMAAAGDLPRWFDAVHPTHRIPHHAELTVGLLVAVVVAFTDLRGAIGFSAFAVLVYYAVANASAWSLRREQRAGRVIPAVGFVACLVLCLSLPAESVATGGAVLTVGALVWAVRALAARRGRARSV